MSKKNSNVILKENFNNDKELSGIYLNFKKKLHKLKKKPILIAVSGGPDSLALSALAKLYSLEKNCKIYFVLIDHNLRKNSSKEALSVKKLLKKYQINLSILKNKKKINNNIQSKARKVRYNLIVDFCKKKRIKNVLTAHNLEDQVETFFIRLSRGSGLQGLSSMKTASKIDGNINLIRPLLDLKKTQLTKISKRIFGRFFKDPTNKNIKYLRTRIRNLKEPLEKSGISYNQIFKSIKNLASSRDTLELYFDKIYEYLVDKKNKKILIKYNDFNILNSEMKMKILKQSIKDLTNAYYSPRTKKIFNLVHHIESNNKIKYNLGGCDILKEKKRIILKISKKNQLLC